MPDDRPSLGPTRFFFNNWEDRENYVPSGVGTVEKSLQVFLGEVYDGPLYDQVGTEADFVEGLFYESYLAGDTCPTCPCTVVPIEVTATIALTLAASATYAIDKAIYEAEATVRLSLAATASYGLSLSSIATVPLSLAASSTVNVHGPDSTTQYVYLRIGGGTYTLRTISPSPISETGPDTDITDVTLTAHAGFAALSITGPTSLGVASLDAYTAATVIDDVYEWVYVDLSLGSITYDVEATAALSLRASATSSKTDAPTVPGASCAAAPLVSLPFVATYTVASGNEHWFRWSLTSGTVYHITVIRSGTDNFSAAVSEGSSCASLTFKASATPGAPCGSFTAAASDTAWARVLPAFSPSVTYTITLATGAC